MLVLGISSGFHDAAAALVADGELVAAVEQERLSRTKHDPDFPAHAADVCLAIAGAAAADVDVVAFHEKPLAVVNRHLSTRLRSGPRSLRTLLLDTPATIRQQLTVPHEIDRWFRDREVTPAAVRYAEHHVSHAAAAFYPSPFDEAAILTLDGVGEWATSTIGEGRGGRLRLSHEQRFPDSLGLLYSAFTTYCGFRANGGEGELMGLAPLGTPRHAATITDRLVHRDADGSFHLDQRYFSYLGGRHLTSPRFHDLFGGPPRPQGSAPTEREADLAASVQLVVEELILAMAAEAHRATGLDHLCLSGGVALNCVANGRVRREGPFADVWVQPAAGDAGSAVGAALWLWHHVLNRPRTAASPDGMHGAFLGPAFERAEIEAWLQAEGIDHTVVADDDERCRTVAERIDAGAVVGWFTGRMEFGPRALGHRSILADPRAADMQGRINDLVKERASFRPFAPAVLADRASAWFDVTGASPYMTVTGQVVDGDVAIPAVTHVDGSARIQTVDQEQNPAFARLLRHLDAVNGCPVVLNTSFNARDEPIVCSPEDAHRTFVRTGLDLLVLEHCLIERQP